MTTPWAKNKQALRLLEIFKGLGDVSVILSAWCGLSSWTGTFIFMSYIAALWAVVSELAFSPLNPLCAECKKRQDLCPLEISSTLNSLVCDNNTLISILHCADGSLGVWEQTRSVEIVSVLCHHFENGCLKIPFYHFGFGCSQWRRGCAASGKERFPEWLLSCPAYVGAHIHTHLHAKTAAHTSQLGRSAHSAGQGMQAGDGLCFPVSAADPWRTGGRRRKVCYYPLRECC